MRAWRSLTLVCCLLPALAGPAGAQMSVLVVPEGSAVVVPPRGGGAMPPAASRVVAPRPAFTPPPAPEPGLDLADPGTLALIAALPLAVAGAVLASGLPGSGAGGASGPVRTR